MAERAISSDYDALGGAKAIVHGVIQGVERTVREGNRKAYRDEAKQIKTRQQHGYGDYGDYATMKGDSDQRRFREMKRLNRRESQRIRRIGR